MENCYHCGDPCLSDSITHQDKTFCCNGCKTVYDILHENDLEYYYNLDQNPGISPKAVQGKFDFLNNETILDKLLDFNEQNTQIVSFTIPAIHCSSCIWVLENLNKLNAAIKNTQVNFPEKSIRITYDASVIALKQVVELLCMLGYEPAISLEDFNKTEKKTDRSLIYKLGVAGFAFGNIMFLSFPEYFEVEEFWLDQYKHLFRGLMLAFSIPVVVYSAQDYFRAAYKSIRSKLLNIDVPIALGILVLFVRSCAEVLTQTGTGFFDSLAGLVFFLLLGKFFQQKTYAFLSFERDYKSYFPIAVTLLKPAKHFKNRYLEQQVPIYELQPDDRILIRNGELIPVDGILLKGEGLLDYSFVTGEAEPVAKNAGDTLFAGGRQQGGIIEIRVTKAVEQSYLTQLWSNEAFKKEKQTHLNSLTAQISKHFTWGVLSIATVAGLFWLVYDPSMALNVFTAILIVACPCALALSAPFTLGNLLRITGNHKLYLKDAAILEQLADVDHIVFDKTGTLTTSAETAIRYEGLALTEDEESLVTSTLRASNHPLSRSLYAILKNHDIQTLDEFEEEVGHGIYGTANHNSVKIGSYDFVGGRNANWIFKNGKRTVVHISTNATYKGCYVFYNRFRESLPAVFEALSTTADLAILSGDNTAEKQTLERLIKQPVQMHFNQKPDDKLNFIKSLQQQGKRVLMIGDGLNDSGALAQSDVGIAISENINVFSPACDGILDASRFKDLPQFIQLAKRGKRIIKWSFVCSLLYNLAGLVLAISGNLKPVYAAILMPLSSISIVVFTTLSSYFYGSKLKQQEKTGAFSKS